MYKKTFSLGFLRFSLGFLRFLTIAFFKLPDIFVKVNTLAFSNHRY